MLTVRMADKLLGRAATAHARLQRNSRYVATDGDRQLRLAAIDSAFTIARLSADGAGVRTALQRLRTAVGATAAALWSKAFVLHGAPPLPLNSRSRLACHVFKCVELLTVNGARVAVQGNNHSYELTCRRD